VWDDVEGEIRQQYSLGQSLRQIKEQLDERLRSSVGLRTINERVQQIARLVSHWRSSTVVSVPPVVRVDGIWLPVMRPTGRFKHDRLGRYRAVKQSEKVPILVAQGVWPASGEQQIVAWVLGEAEDEASWEALLTQMWQRGITPETGLCLLVADGAAGLEAARHTVYWDVPFQRCVFHKLRNLRDAIEPPPDLDSKAARAYRRRFLSQAARIWRAPHAEEARCRYATFCQDWAAQQPDAVAALCRDFDQTLTFYHVRAAARQRGEHWPVRLLRTTSPLERELRFYRRRFDQATLFHSFFGVAAVMHSLSFRRRAGSNSLPLQWHHSLERALASSSGIS
jgi:transposase-like protein